VQGSVLAPRQIPSSAQESAARSCRLRCLGLDVILHQDRTGRLAGVRRIRVHDTRHTCGSLLAAMDVHPRVAMQILRHSKIAPTMEIYTHVPSEVTRRALKQLGRAWMV
jgi:integrase